MTRTWPWLGALAVAGVVAILSSMPASRFGSSVLWQHDKLVHASVWSMLGGLCAAGGVARGWRLGVVVLVALVLGAAYGAVDELHQRFTPGRDSSLGDLLADTIGALAGAVAVAAHAVYRRR